MPPAATTGRSRSRRRRRAPEAVPDPARGAPPREPWVLGVATMLDVDRTLGSPMGHLAVHVVHPGERRVRLSRAGDVAVHGQRALGRRPTCASGPLARRSAVQYAFAPAQARWRPFVGLATGSQVLLTDTSGAAPRSTSRRAVRAQRQLRAVHWRAGHRRRALSCWPRSRATRDWLLQSSIAPTIATASPTRWPFTRRWARCSNTEHPARVL